MNLVYVQRNDEGDVVGVYAQPQPQEDGADLTDAQPIPADDAEVLAYLAAFK